MVGDERKKVKPVQIRSEEWLGVVNSCFIFRICRLRKRDSSAASAAIGMKEETKKEISPTEMAPNSVRLSDFVGEEQIKNGLQRRKCSSSVNFLLLYFS